MFGIKRLKIQIEAAFCQIRGMATELVDLKKDLRERKIINALNYREIPILTAIDIVKVHDAIGDILDYLGLEYEHIDRSPKLVKKKKVSNTKPIPEGDEISINSGFDLFEEQEVEKRE